jgi:hypothetical protein
LLPATISLVAQRVPHEHVPEVPNHELNEESVRQAHEESDRTKPSGHVEMSKEQLEKLQEIERDIEAHPIQLPVAQPTTLRWEKTQDSSGHPSWSATSQTGKQAKVDFNSLEKSLTQGEVIINEGALPQGKEWRELNARYPDQMTFHEPESANRTPEDIRAALHLGDRPLDPAKVKVFNALPHETELLNHIQEQNRMSVGGTLDYWKGLHKDIEASSGAMIPHRATKEKVLEELRAGTSNVVMLYAHSDGEQLYMPGANGGTIHADELEQIDRRGDPGVHKRIVILVACQAGAKTPNNPRSLASVLLKKGVARTVFATDRPFESGDITKLLEKLANGMPPRMAVGLHEYNGSSLHQYVELESPVLNGPAERGEHQDWGE